MLLPGQTWECSVLDVVDRQGLWRRTFLQQEDGAVDRTSQVLWLQSARFFIDLRQPADLPSCAGVLCLRDLSADHLMALARQEGFCGHLDVSDSVAQWHREADFQPPSRQADRARLQLDDGILTEIGTEQPYVEQWARQTDAGATTWGARLAERGTGRMAFLVRVGDHLMFARPRATPLSAETSLRALLEAAGELSAQQDLMDFEISLGQLDDRGWRIERSTLPFKVATRWDLRRLPGGLSLADVDPFGAPVTRFWDVVETDAGDIGFGPAPPPPKAAARQPAAFTSIPVIDVGDLVAHGPDASPATVARIAKAAREVGFFSIIGHGCPPILRHRLLTQAQRFFALPMADKMAVYIGHSRNHRGYVPEGEEGFSGPPDKKEAFDLSIDLPADDPDAQRYPLLGPNQWPDLPGFADDVMAYYDSTFAAGRRLMQAFAVILGRPSDFFDDRITRPPSQLRLLHYAFNADARDAIGIGSHTDYECLTLLLATVPGLEVMNGAGQWIDAPPVPGGLIINIGDMLELMSNGALIATSHRVRKVSAERYSFPLFFSLDYPTHVAPLVGDGEARTGMVAGEHLYAQTIQTFRYLQARLARGEVALPEGALKPLSFGQAARHKEAAA